jgi:hypothetical protein
VHKTVGVAMHQAPFVGLAAVHECDAQVPVLGGEATGALIDLVLDDIERMYAPA